MDYLYILREALVWIITIFWLYQLLVSLCSLVKIKDKPLKVKKDHRFMGILSPYTMRIGNLVSFLNSLRGTPTAFVGPKKLLLEI